MAIKITCFGILIIYLDKCEIHVKLIIFVFVQNPLPPKICQEVDELVENCLTAKLCEVVRTLTLVVQFLAKVYAQDVNFNVIKCIVLYLCC